MNSKAKQIVIIGNGGAGLSAIRAIRSVDPVSPITLLSSEDCFAYSPVATTYYIAGKISRRQLFVTDEAFYRRLNVRLLLKKRALEIDAERASVAVEGSGGRIPYDELLIATGATPTQPAGDPEGQVLSLRTLEDAERILSLLPHSGKAVILGGGLVSLQLAQTLWHRGLEITVLVGSDRVLSRNVDPRTSLLVQREMESKGISFHLCTEAVSFVRNGDQVHVHTNTDRTLSASLLLCGKGIRPNLLDGALTTDGAMEVDARMRTRCRNVYAAGDVSRVKHLISGKWESMANWPNACYQGWVAGLNMAGRQAELEGLLNQNITHLFGLRLASIGVFQFPPGKGGEVLEWSEEGQKVHRKIYLKEGKVVGAVLVNAVEDIGLIRNLIVRGREVSREKLNAANLFSSHFHYSLARQSLMTGNHVEVGKRSH